MEQPGADDPAQDEVNGDFVDSIFLHAFALCFPGGQPDTNPDGSH